MEFGICCSKEKVLKKTLSRNNALFFLANRLDMVSNTFNWTYFLNYEKNENSVERFSHFIER